MGGVVFSTKALMPRSDRDFLCDKINFLTASFVFNSTHHDKENNAFIVYIFTRSLELFPNP